MYSSFDNILYNIDTYRRRKRERELAAGRDAGKDKD